MGWGWLAGVDTDVAMPPVVATPTFWEDLRGGGALLQVVGGVSLVVAGLWFEVWVAIGSGQRKCINVVSTLERKAFRVGHRMSMESNVV